jgi:TruD family tRNA pseudouridine synthase
MEKKSFEERKAEFPQQFIAPLYVEDAKFLSRFGIVIPGKESFPLAYVKHTPQDFVVEEISPEGSVYTIEYKDFLQNIRELPENAPTFYATLVKCSLTTFEAIRILAEQLGCSVENIQYAGIKDLRAVTAQRISIRGVTRDQIARVAHPQFFLKDIEAGKGVLTQGELTGNRFTILVRTEESVHTEFHTQNIVKNLISARDHGFYNFFYLQRFGTPRLINYKWGKDILLGNYEAVIKSLLTEASDTELPYFKGVRSKLGLCYGNWIEMKRVIDDSIPDSFGYESTVLTHLSDHPNDFLGALKLIEQQSIFWVHAYMSKLFNACISDLLVSNKAVPAHLPLPLSHEFQDLLLYKKFFEKEGMYPPPWKNLRPFPKIRTAHREVFVKPKVTIHMADVCPEGIRFSFSLDKGQYATTFLSHVFNLVSGVDPETENRFILNHVQSLSQKTYEYFKDSLEGTAAVVEE